MYIGTRMILINSNTINGKSPSIFENYFPFHKINHQHETVNSLNSIYSLPTGSLELPIYRTESGKSSIRFICSTIWNSTLKDLSMKNIEKYNKDPFWICKTNIKNLKRILQKHFLEHYWIQNNLIINVRKNLFLSFSFFFYQLIGKSMKMISTLYQLPLFNTFK